MFNGSSNRPFRLLHATWVFGCLLLAAANGYAESRDAAADDADERRLSRELYNPPVYGQVGEFIEHPPRKSSGGKRKSSPTDPERYQPFGAPILGGNVDIGFLFGATSGVVKHSRDYRPYRWKANANAATSIKKGFDSVEFPVTFGTVEFDIPGLAKGRLRLFPLAEFRRIINAGYYGFGTGSSAQGTDPAATEEQDYHRNQYGMMLVKGRLNAHIDLVHRLYILTGASFRYLMPTVYDGSALEADSQTQNADGDPLISGTWDQAVVGLHLGLGYDTRDNPLNPERGMFHDVVVSLSPGRPDAVHCPLYGSLTLHTRFYVPLAGEYLVLALRLRGDLFFGSAPFYDLDLGTIRGVPRGRYHGLVHVLGTVEFRSVFVSVSVNKQRFGFGAAAFVDSGRVWADYGYDPDLDGAGAGLAYGVGGGLRFLMGGTGLLRIDVAYSPDAVDLNPDIPVGIYVHFGQFF